MALLITESLEDGRALYVLETDGDLMGIVPATMLDDVLGDAASASERRKWVEGNSSEISKALRVKRTGAGYLRRPFDEIVASTKII